MLQGNPSANRVALALLHHSMRDKQGAIVTTAVTNLDIHDIARSSRTYGLAAYYIVNPEPQQQAVVNRITGHWQSGGGRDYNPDRAEAFRLIRVVSWLEDAVKDMRERFQAEPFVVMTSARKVEGVKELHSAELRKLCTQAGERPVLLVFGTGHGIDDAVIRKSDALLEPILPEAESGYNHLSVRSAVAIFLDRIFGARSP